MGPHTFTHSVDSARQRQPLRMGGFRGVLFSQIKGSLIPPSATPAAFKLQQPTTVKELP